jgi:(p)ppGpp synthase/HD superfamily hydrolase
MIYSKRIEHAIRVGSLLHRGQLRKGDGTTPFITHPFVMAYILVQYTEDEDTIIAGILHDSIEDTDYTLEQLEIDFGLRVKEMVCLLTECKRSEKMHTTWMIRKERYLEQMKEMNTECLLVSAVDKFHNLHTMMYDYKTLGEDMWKRFNAPKDKRLWFYGEALKILKERLDSPIVGELEKVLEQAKIDFALNPE